MSMAIPMRECISCKIVVLSFSGMETLQNLYTWIARDLDPITANKNEQKATFAMMKNQNNQRKILFSTNTLIFFDRVFRGIQQIECFSQISVNHSFSLSKHRTSDKLQLSCNLSIIQMPLSAISSHHDIQQWQICLPWVCWTWPYGLHPRAHHQGRCQAKSQCRPPRKQEGSGR